jgi:hypothetical protein
MTQVEEAPMESAAIPVWVGVTGTALLEEFPFPNSPEPLNPQQRAVPSERTIQVSYNPEEMDTAPESPVTELGEKLSIGAPLPSRLDEEIPPKQRTAPSLTITQVW